MAKRTILTKIQDIPHKYLVAVLIAMCIFFQLVPLVFPVEVERVTQECFDYIEAIPEGQVLVYDLSSSFLTKTILETYYLMLQKHLFARPGLKIIAVSFSAPGPINWEMMMRMLPPNLLEKKTYGVDYVYLGYIPGDEIAISNFCSDIRSVCTTDFYGTNLDDLELMNSGNPNTGGPINDATAFYATTFKHWNSPMLASYVRIFGDLWNVDIIAPNSEFQRWSSIIPYYPKYVKAIYIQEKTEQYEYLLGVRYGITGINMVFHVTRNYVSAFLFSLTVVANVAWYMDRRIQGRGKVEEVTR